VSLVRRTTRSGQSDLHSEDAPPDEDAARWTEAIKQKRAWKKRREEEDDERVIVGTKVDQNHGNWVTAYNMLTGIRFVVSRVNAKMERELTPADFEAKHKFSFDITGNELTPSAKYDFKFKDYAPWVFRSLRAKFKLDPADYLMSLTSKYILSELGSPGKSGSFFYFSRDYKYIIKTIHHGEHKLLRKILPDYYQHIEQNPNTLISQFYGLHRVKMAYGRKIHFVVMNNLFPPHRDIHQMFDLKGSTVGRDLREEDLVNNPRATMKDLNWLRRQRHIELGPMKRGVFLAQLKRDVTLLQRLNIMDYSLLIGIHDLTRGNEEKLRDKTLQVFQPGGDREEDPIANLLTRTPSKLENMRKARELRLTLKKERPVPLERTGAKMPDEILDERKNLVFYSDDGGFRATHENGQPGDEIYYLGVIDCLTHYGMLKKAETFWKGLSHNRAQISPIPSHNYGDRFMNFIEEITMSKEEAERRQQTRDQGSASQDISRSSLGFRRSSVERSMQQVVEKEPARDGLEPHSRTLMAVRDTTDPTATLPVVEEAGEAGSTGSEKNPLNGGQSLEEPRDGDRERWINSADHVGNFSYLSDAQRLAPTSKKGKGREMVYIPGGPTFQHSR
jgi:1-phosphatidylinositol-4-phosphate 5-kinase